MSTIIKILLGVVAILGASTILSMPALSGMIICWCMTGIMLVFGIVAIIRYIEAKNTENVAKKNGLPYLNTGIGSLVFGIAAVVLAILARSSAEGTDLFMKIVTVIFGLWIVLDGVSVIKHGLAIKQLGLPGWIGMFIMGILVVLAGIFCMVNCFAGLTAMSTMYGISLMMAGFALLIA